VSYRIGARGRQRLDTAFIARMRSGHTGVFRRTGDTRLPIVELFGPSITRVFSKHRPAGLAAGQASLRKNLQHELGWAIDQARQGS
jgi:hypothetical protein